MDPRRLMPRFTIRRLLATLVLFAGSLVVVRHLAGIGKFYEEYAVLYIFAPVDWPDGKPIRLKPTDKDLEEHARRLVSSEVLDRAADLLNGQIAGPDEGSEDHHRRITPVEFPFQYTCPLKLSGRRVAGPVLLLLAKTDRTASPGLCTRRLCAESPDEVAVARHVDTDGDLFGAGTPRTPADANRPSAPELGHHL
jgi:hypothetical protein